MKLSEAVSKRICELCEQKGLSHYKLSKLSSVRESTISSLVNCKYTNIKLVSIMQLCIGFGITIKEFFDSPIFDSDTIHKGIL